jgi:hypothetical protein
VDEKFKFGSMRLLIKLGILLVKNYFISCHISKLLKYLSALKTMSSYSGSGEAFAQSVQMDWENPFISYYTSSLYLLA